MENTLTTPSESPTIGTRTRSLDALTGLRFVAALCVFVVHFLPRFHVKIGTLQALGNPAVSFFFVLSGFILTYAYSGRIGAGFRARYFVSRVSRIWPIHLVSLGIFLAVLARINPSGGLPGIAELWPYVALVQSWSTDSSFIIRNNGAAWSLSVEAFLYLVFPLLCVLSPRRFGWAYATIVLLTGIALGVGERLWAQSTGTTEWLKTVCRLTPPPHLFEFATGMAAARIATRRVIPATKTPLRDSAMDFGCIALIALAHGTFGRKGWIDALLPADSAPLTLVFLKVGGGYALPFALVICWFARSSGAVAWLFSRRPALFLGEISFAFFLIHTPVQLLAMHSSLSSHMDWRIPFAISLSATLAAATLLHRWVEVPVRDLIVAAWEKKLATQWPAIRTGLFSARCNIPVFASVLLLIATPTWVRKTGAVQNSAEIAALVRSTPPELRNVIFADEAEIVAAHGVEKGKSVELTIVYSMLPGARRELKVHATDPDGNIVRQFPTRLSSFQQPDGRVLTVARTRCSRGELRGVSSLGIVFWKKGLGTAVPDRGPRTMNGRRLEVFTVPTELSEAQSVSDDDASLGDG